MKFIINSRPIPLKRYRFTKDGKTYNPQTSYMESISFFINHQYMSHTCSNNFKEGPLSIDVTFFMQIPRSKSKKRKNLIKDTYHISKIDLDNMIKMLLDCITMSGIITDDCQFVVITAKKIWALEARTEFEINSISVVEASN